MPRRQGYALLIALVAGTAMLAAAVAFGTTLLSGPRSTPLPPAETQAAARNPVDPATSGGRWVATWTAAPVGAEPGTEDGLPGRTIRNVVHTSVGGEVARITLSNLFGTGPLVIDQATVNTRPVTFKGADSVTVAPGGQVVSDPVVVPVAPDSDLQVSFRTPQAGGPVTYHPYTHQTSYLIDDRGTWSSAHWRYLTAVDVRSERARRDRRLRGLPDGGQRLHHRRQRPLDRRPRRPAGRPVRNRQRGHRGQPGRGRRPGHRGPVGHRPARPRRPVGRRGPDGRRGARHQRRTAVPPGGRRAAHRGQPARPHRPGARPRAQGRRRDADPVRGLRHLDAPAQRRTPGGQRADPGGHGVRRVRGLRRGGTRPRRAEPDPLLVRLRRPSAPQRRRVPGARRPAGPEDPGPGGTPRSDAL